MVKSRQLVREYRAQIGKYTYEQMDCIHSIANIIYRHGGKADLTGSNWWARHEIKNLRPLYSRDQLYDGCAVLKTIHPGEPGYNLPDRYKNDVNQIDYNHIGLGTDWGEILDSTRTSDGRDGPGISTAPISNKSWDVIGDFEDVDYSDRFEDFNNDTNKNPEEEGTEPLEGGGIAKVVAESGNTVNLRASASRKSHVYAYVPIGNFVDVVQSGPDGKWNVVNNDEGEWVRVAYNGRQGWMMSQFLVPAERSPAPEPEKSKEIDDLLSEAEELADRLAELVREARRSV